MHLTKIKFGTDGWRAIMDKEYTMENVQRLAQAFALYMHEYPMRNKKHNKPRVVVGYDFRKDSENFAEGDTIDVSYIIDSKDSIKLELPNKPISGSVLFEGLDETCLATAGKTLAQIVEVRCNLDDAAEFQVLYSYLAENREFELDSEQSISKYDLLLFSDGDPVKDFTLSGKVIKLADHIIPGEKIVVHHIMGH